MHRTTAYLAHPIDQAGDSRTGIDRMAADLTRLLTRDGWHVYRPGTAWTVTPSLLPSPELEEVNQFALVNAGVVVAYLPEGVPTIGVPMEIERARLLNIPVIVVTPLSDRSFTLARAGFHLLTEEQIYHAATLCDDDEDGCKCGATREWNRITARVRGLAAALRRTDDLRVVLTHDGASVPARAYEDDAGVDLHLAEKVTIEPGGFLDLQTTVTAVQLPDGYWGLITGRSSTLRRYRLHVPMAVIDPGWRGPLFVGAWNLGGSPITLHPGDRIGQLILMPNNPAPVTVVDKVDDAPRGTNGFGSSG